MNCKPGDLAIIINTGTVHEDWLGTIVEVGEMSPDWINHWRITWPGKKPISCKWAIQSCADIDLRPVSGLPLQEDTDIAAHLHTNHTTGTTTKAPA